MELPRSIRAIFNSALRAEGSLGANEGVYEVLVIGAGVAGLAAAQALRVERLRTLTLKARDRIGGRV